MLRGGEQDVDGENCLAQDRRQIRDTGVVRHGHGLLRKGGLRAKLHARPSRPFASWPPSGGRRIRAFPQVPILVTTSGNRIDRGPFRGVTVIVAPVVDVPRAPSSMRRFPFAPARFRQCTMLLAAASVLAALPVAAQRTARRDSMPAMIPGSVLHVVKRRDTLHEIARRYLGSAARWPELFKANSAQIANANLIFPGQKLYVGADGKPTFNAPVAKAVAETVNTTPARVVTLGRPTTGQSASPLENATINGRTLRPTVRRGEADAAPLLVTADAKSNAGALVSRADPTVVSATHSRDQFQLFDDVDVLLPVGMRASVGQRFGAFQRGPEIRDGKLRRRIMQPSGVVEVVALGSGRAARARVTAMYQDMKRGDMLLPIEPSAAVETVRPTEVVDGPVYEVAYVAGDVVLPTIQNYVVIALPSGARSKVGDLFALFASGNALTEGTKDVAPANRVAQVSVVRVTTEGATAVVVGHDQPAIRVGMKAQLVSRMP